MPAEIGYAPSRLLSGSFSQPTQYRDISGLIDNLRGQYMMAGQELPEFTGGDPTEYLVNLYYRDAKLATQLAQDAGIPKEQFLNTVAGVDSAAQDARGSNVLGTIGNLTSVGRGEVSGVGDFLGDAAKLGAIGYGTSFLGGGAVPTTGSGTATVSASNTAAGIAPAAGGATTFPLATGGTVAGSAIPGVTSGTTAANAAAAGIGAAPAAASGLGGLGLGGWLTVGALGAQALQGNKDMVTNTTNAPPAFVAPYLSGAAQQASNLYGQGNYVAPVTQSAINYGSNVLNGDYLNNNPYLDDTFKRAAGAVTNQVQSNFGLSGRNPRGIDAAGFAREGYNDLANQIYGGNYQAERQRQQQVLPYAGQLGAYTNPGVALDDYIGRLRNLSGGYGNTTSSTPTQQNWLGGLAGLGLALMQ